MKIIVSLVLALCLTGCVNNQTTYHWGNYEQVVYDMYKNPGEATADQQLTKLRQDVEIAASKGKPVPPGVFAHMGMLYASMGNSEQAKLSLNEELAHYPESAIFVDGLLTRLEKGKE
ncbi:MULTISPECIES: DUF4810 domain-containing protein [Cellvibrio]|nr:MULTISPECIES: DUF4810 domain-containing protein [Cellvibrio]AQT61957.1 hypothetical protein B0D95_18960 [Cellvibrio sp. PSBB023]